MSRKSVLRFCGNDGSERARRASTSLDMDAHASGQILDILPGDTAGAGAASGCPFQCLGVHPVAFEPELEMVGIAVDHAEIIFLAAFVEAEPETEAVG